MPRILILEDYPPLRRAQVMTLQRAGWYVVSTPSAQEALRAMAQDGFDVLLVDMDMTTRESWRILRILHADPDRHAVVALLSPGSQRQRELEALGVTVSLYKPISREALLMGVKMALQERC